MEPRQYRPKGGMSVSEGRNGGGAKACPVELAMAQNGRAIRTTVLKSTVQKITVQKSIIIPLIALYLKMSYTEFIKYKSFI